MSVVPYADRPDLHARRYEELTKPTFPACTSNEPGAVADALVRAAETPGRRRAVTLAAAGRARPADAERARTAL